MSPRVFAIAVCIGSGLAYIVAVLAAAALARFVVGPYGPPVAVAIAVAAGVVTWRRHGGEG